MREEHREYWYNQEQVVPILGYAVDPEMEWSAVNVKQKWQRHWSNVRMALVSALVRVRLVLLACALAIVLPIFGGDDVVHSLLQAPENVRDNTTFASIKVPIGGISLEKAFCADKTYFSDHAATCAEVRQREDSTNTVQGLLEFLSEHDDRGSFIAALAVLLVAYLAMNVYTELFWAQLARGSMPFGAARPEDDGVPNFKARPFHTAGIVILAPFVMSLAILAVDLPFLIWFTLLGASLVVSIAEWGWLLLTIKAAKFRAGGDTAKLGAFNCRLERTAPPTPKTTSRKTGGRKRSASSAETAAGG